MYKSYFAGAAVMLVGSILAIFGMPRFLFGGLLMEAVIESIPLLLAAIMLFLCHKSQMMADLSAALTGCLWGMGLGVGLVAGFGKLLTSRRVHPYDEMAFGILVLLAILMIVAVGLVDAMRNEKRLSWGRFAWECAIAFSLIVPTCWPAARLMAYFESILSTWVSV